MGKDAIVGEWRIETICCFIARNGKRRGRRCGSDSGINGWEMRGGWRWTGYGLARIG